MTPEWPRPLSFAQFNWELGRIPAAISQDHASGNPGTDPGVHAAKSGPWDTQVRKPGTDPGVHAAKSGPWDTQVRNPGQTRVSRGQKRALGHSGQSQARVGCILV